MTKCTTSVKCVCGALVQQFYIYLHNLSIRNGRPITEKKSSHFLSHRHFCLFLSLFGDTKLLSFPPCWCGYFYSKFFGGHESFLYSHCYSCFGLLVTSALVFKAIVDPSVGFFISHFMQHPPVADLKGRPLRPKFFSIPCGFWENLAKSYVG